MQLYCEASKKFISENDKTEYVYSYGKKYYWSCCKSQAKSPYHHIQKSTSSPLNPDSELSNTSPRSSPTKISPSPIPVAKFLSHETLSSMEFEKVPCSYVKVVIVGNGRVGKTSTIKSLLGVYFNRNQPSTVGIEISELEIKISPNISNNIIINNNNIITSSTGKPRKNFKCSKKQPDQKHFKIEAAKVAAAAKRVNKKLDFVNPPAEVKPIAAVIPMNSNNNNNNNNNTETNHSNTNTPLVMVSEEDVKKAEEERSATLIVYDCGGQDMYQIANELFFSKGSLILIAFDLEKLYNDYVDKQQDADLDFLGNWFEAISVHTPFSPILLIGTKHKPTFEEDNLKKISSLIENKFCGAFYWGNVVRPESSHHCFFPIDNTANQILPSHAPLISDLKECMHQTIQTHECFKTTYTLQYMRVLDDIMEYRKRFYKWKNIANQAESNSSIILSMVEFEDLFAKKYSISGQQLAHLLETFHRLGLIVHFKISTSYSYIILQPQVLIDALVCVMDAGTGNNIKNPLLKEDLKIYNKKAVISLKLLDHLWKNTNLKLSEHECNVFCSYMLKLCLMIEEKDRNVDDLEINFSDEFVKKSDIKFLVPSILKPNEETAKVENASFSLANFKEAKFAHLEFILKEHKNVRLYPQGLFYRFVVKAMHATSMTTSTAFQPIIQQNNSLVSVAESKIWITNDKKEKKINLVIDSSFPGPILSLFRYFLDEIIVESYPELACRIYVNVGDNFLHLDELEADVEKGRNLGDDDNTVKDLLINSGSSHGSFELKVGWTSWLKFNTTTNTSPEFDVFISYRETSEKTIAKLLHCGLLCGSTTPKLTGNTVTTRYLKVFLDKYCISQGQEWSVRFANALFNSSFFCPLVSSSCIDIMEAKILKNDVDNVLLEWMLAVESFRINGKDEGIIPIFESEDLYNTETKSKIMERLNCISSATNEKCVFYLSAFFPSLNSIDKVRISKIKGSDIFAALCGIQAASMKKFTDTGTLNSDWKVVLPLATKLRSIIKTQLSKPTEAERKNAMLMKSIQLYDVSELTYLWKEMFPDNDPSFIRSSGMNGNVLLNVFKRFGNNNQAKIKELLHLDELQIISLETRIDALQDVLAQFPNQQALINNNDNNNLNLNDNQVGNIHITDDEIQMTDNQTLDNRDADIDADIDTDIDADIDTDIDIMIPTIKQSN